MSSTPLWVSILTLCISLISVGISIWLATRSFAAKNAQKQLELLLEKSQYDKILSYAIAFRVADANSIELFLTNLNSTLIYIDLTRLNNKVVNLANYIGYTFNPVIKSGENIALIRATDEENQKRIPLASILKTKTYILEVFIALTSDPSHMHVLEIEIAPNSYRTKSSRISKEKYSEIKEKYYQEAPDEPWQIFASPEVLNQNID